MAKQDSFEVSDRRRTPIYLDFRLDDLNLSAGAFRVYAHLARRANAKFENNAWPSYTSIGEVCFRGTYPNATPETLRRKAIYAVKELEQTGLVKKILRPTESGGYKSNSYYLTDISDWNTPLVPLHQGSATAPGVVPLHQGSATAPKDTLSEDTLSEDSLGEGDPATSPAQTTEAPETSIPDLIPVSGNGNGKRPAREPAPSISPAVAEPPAGPVAPPTQPAAPKRQDLLFEAVADACKQTPPDRDWSLLPKGLAGQIGKATAELRRLKADPEKVSAFEQWWYQNTFQGRGKADFRGNVVEPGRPPKPAEIVSHWNIFLAAPAGEFDFGAGGANGRNGYGQRTRGRPVDVNKLTPYQRECYERTGYVPADD